MAKSETLKVAPGSPAAEGIGYGVPVAGGCPVAVLTALLPRRMSMRSPVSPHLELDGAGSMVNCTIKTEEKKEGGCESPPGAAPSTEPRPNDPAGPPPKESSDPQALPQVGSTAVTDTGAGWGPAGLAEHCCPPRSGAGLRLLAGLGVVSPAVIPHPEETRMKPEAPPRLSGCC